MPCCDSFLFLLLLASFISSITLCFSAWVLMHVVACMSQNALNKVTTNNNSGGSYNFDKKNYYSGLRGITKKKAFLKKTQLFLTEIK